MRVARPFGMRERERENFVNCYRFFRGSHATKHISFLVFERILIKNYHPPTGIVQMIEISAHMNFTKKDKMI